MVENYKENIQTLQDDNADFENLVFENHNQVFQWIKLVMLKPD